MEDLTEMACNKQPHIMCPDCFKGTVVMRYTQHDGECNICNTRFTLNGMTLKYK